MSSRLVLASSFLAALAACGRLEYSERAIDAGSDAARDLDGSAERDAGVQPDGGPEQDAGFVDAGPRLDGGACALGTYAAHDYALCAAEVTWLEARAACETMAMHLARIDDAGEQAFIESLAPTSRAWIGASDLRLEGTWEWLDGAIYYVHSVGGGTSFGYLHWGSAEPNGAMRDNCAAIVSSGYWIDTGCDLPSSFVCERP